MDQEFKFKLKDTLVNLESRMSALEHSVNNVILKGLRDAADEYADEENYNAFTATYGDSIGKYSDPMKVLCGDDFDLCKELYSALKEAEGYGTEGFDEKALVDGKLKDIEAKLSKLKTPVEVEVKKEDSEDKSEEDEEPSEEEIARIYKEYKGE